MTRLFLWILLPAILLASCKEAGVEIGSPLAIELAVDRTSGVAGEDIFTFQYQAEGRSLSRVILTFGDAVADTFSVTGMTSARATRTHTYENPGTYSAIAWVFEAAGDSLSDGVQVQVQEP